MSADEKPWKLQSFHKRLLRELFYPPKLDDEEALRVLFILHTCIIRFRFPIFDGRPDSTGVEELTIVGAAECISTLWKGQRDPRNRTMYWAEQFFSWVGDRLGWGVFPSDVEKFCRLRDVFLSHPIVKDLEPSFEDFSPFVSRRMKPGE